MRSARSFTTAIIVAVIASLFAALTPARAQTPTIDLSVLAKATETVSNTLKQVQSLTTIEGVVGKLSDAAGVGTQLGQLKGLLQVMGNPGDAVGALTQLGQLKGILNVIGQVNQTAQQLKSILNIANMFGNGSIKGSLPSFDGIKPLLGSLQQFGQLAGNQKFSTVLQGLQNTFSNPPNNLASLQGQITQNLYHSGSGTTKDVEAINAVRSANTRAAATGGMAVAVQGKDYLAKSTEEIKKLSESLKEAKDLRGDVQANTAVLLKLIEVVQVGNAQLAAQTHLNAAQTIASDNYNTADSSSSGTGGN